MTDTPPELPPLPCPFCGHATAPTVISSTVWDEALGIEHDESNVPTFAVMCDATHPGGPGGCGGGGGFQETEAQAVQAWNRRALAARPAAVAVEPVATVTVQRVPGALNIFDSSTIYSQDGLKRLGNGKHALYAADPPQDARALLTAVREAIAACKSATGQHRQIDTYVNAIDIANRFAALPTKEQP